MLAGGKKKGTVCVVTEIVQPVVEELGLELWDVRFEKEGAFWYLRVFIDKEGGVTIEDCENVSRIIDKLIDAADPISQSYFLEVCSPGIGRELVKPWHFQKFIGSPIVVRLIRPVDGVRDFEGILSAADGDQITLTMDLDGEEIEMVFERKEAAYVRLSESIDEDNE